MLSKATSCGLFGIGCPTGQAHRLSLSPNASNWSMTSCATGLNGTTAVPKETGDAVAVNSGDLQSSVLLDFTSVADKGHLPSYA